MLKDTERSAQTKRPVVEALIEALPEGSILLGPDVTQRSAGIWRDDHLLAEVLIRPQRAWLKVV